LTMTIHGQSISCSSQCRVGSLGSCVSGYESHVTPHTLRRTYVSIMLLATNFDVTYVQHQVGHTESRMTLDVYAQPLDRRKREHGAAFDALLADARGTLYGTDTTAFGPPFGPPASTPPDTPPEPIPPTPAVAGDSQARPARFERATSRSGGVA
jgi:Phage integrase family